jgi:hypothetical protein
MVQMFYGLPDQGNLEIQLILTNAQISGFCVKQMRPVVPIFMN